MTVGNAPGVVHEVDAFDEQFSGASEPTGFRGGQHETPGYVFGEWPGDEPLDDEDSDVTIARLISEESDRLKALVGDSDHVLLTREQAAHHGDAGFKFTDVIRVWLRRTENVNGLACVPVADVLAKPSKLRDCGERALSDFWASVAKSVAPSTEGRAA